MNEKSWKELSEIIGIDSVDRLKKHKSFQYQIKGKFYTISEAGTIRDSNGNKLVIPIFGELSNMIIERIKWLENETDIFEKIKGLEHIKESVKGEILKYDMLDRRYILSSLIEEIDDIRNKEKELKEYQYLKQKFENDK